MKAKTKHPRFRELSNEKLRVLNNRLHFHMKVPNLENPYKSYETIPQGLAQVLSLMVHGRGKVIFCAQQGTMWWHGRWMGRKTRVWTLALPLFNHMAFYESPSLPESGFVDQEMRTITHIALVCSGCHNKVPKTGWCLKNQNLFSHHLESEVHN